MSHGNARGSYETTGVTTTIRAPPEPAARPNLQHPCSRLNVQQLTHDRDQRRCADGGAVADTVGAVPVRLRGASAAQLGAPSSLVAALRWLGGAIRPGLRRGSPTAVRPDPESLREVTCLLDPDPDSPVG